jgi:hypothetical protein
VKPIGLSEAKCIVGLGRGGSIISEINVFALYSSPPEPDEKKFLIETKILGKDNV